ncbi:MAG: alkaline phosphatase family protein [Actinomycetota bacterium]|nr:alkaline phosphatase family protein [Actinomycetota bacterium]
MNNPIRRLAAVAVGAVTVGGALVSGGAGVASAVPAHPQRVLLVSVDGLHQSDMAQCIATDLCPNLAALENHGTSYTNAMTSEPSDSSPGLMALTTGGSPKLTGVYYDDSYDRTLYKPAAQTPTSSQNCSGPPGAETMYAENIDTKAPSTANNQTGTRTILNESIDPTQLPYGIVNGACVPIQPNDFLRTNSIFSVIHQAGLRTAWADKHPAADQQVSGHGTPGAVDDKFMTEINADIIPPTLVDTRGRTVTFPLPNPTGDPNGDFITDKVGNTEAYDQVKVDAVLNEIDGLNSAGTQHVGTPAIFGMNFQTVSVGQKLVDPQLSCVRSNHAPGCDPHYAPGGYEPGTLRFTPQLGGAIASVDNALGSMVSELRSQHLLGSTQIIISAKHGQSPINPAKLALIGHAESTVLSNAGINVAQTTDDDIALLWLKSQSQTPAAVAALQADKAGANTARIQGVLSGEPLDDKFGNPLGDPRTPDLIVQPIPGTIYSTSTAKVAEHGGFSADDTHVALLVVNGADLMAGSPGRSVVSPVQTAQVAPTILASVGLDPKALDAVRIEHVDVLPGVPLH